MRQIPLLTVISSELAIFVKQIVTFVVGNDQSSTPEAEDISHCQCRTNTGLACHWHRCQITNWLTRFVTHQKEWDGTSVIQNHKVKNTATIVHESGVNTRHVGGPVGELCCAHAKPAIPKRKTLAFNTRLCCFPLLRCFSFICFIITYYIKCTATVL